MIAFVSSSSDMSGFILSLKEIFYVRTSDGSVKNTMTNTKMGMYINKKNQSIGDSGVINLLYKKGGKYHDTGRYHV
jgi:hypothetical protein